MQKNYDTRSIGNWEVRKEAYNYNLVIKMYLEGDMNLSMKLISWKKSLS